MLFLLVKSYSSLERCSALSEKRKCSLCLIFLRQLLVNYLCFQRRQEYTSRQKNCMYLASSLTLSLPCICIAVLLRKSKHLCNCFTLVFLKMYIDYVYKYYIHTFTCRLITQHLFQFKFLGAQTRQVLCVTAMRWNRSLDMRVEIWCVPGCAVNRAILLNL